VAQMVSYIRSKWAVSVLAPAILLMGFYDQLPPPASAAANKKHLAKVSEDKAVAAALEGNLHAGAMVFQLPVKAFPETGPIREMNEYDLFRPWLWTSSIRFSYGTMKGRGDADWQAQLANKPLDQMLAELNRYGFSALLINRSAYEDRADQLKEKLTLFGCEILIDQAGYYGFRLRPIDKPDLPHIDSYIATYERGFHGPETDGRNSWRWADSDAVIRITPNWVDARRTGSAASGKVLVSFAMHGIDDRSVWLESGSSMQPVLAPGDSSRQVKLEIDATRFPARLHIFSDRPGLVLGNGDPRKLAFQVRNLRIDKVP